MNQTVKTLLLGIVIGIVLTLTAIGVLFVLPAPQTPSPFSTSTVQPTAEVTAEVTVVPTGEPTAEATESTPEVEVIETAEPTVQATAQPTTEVAATETETSIPTAVLIPSLESSFGDFAGAQAITSWLKIEGRNLTYNGQVVYLRGANFANINALSADIGSGNPSDVQHTQEDYNELARIGGTHVRFGMSYRWYSSNSSAFWTMLDRQISYAKTAGVFFIPLIFTTPADCYEGYNDSCPFWDSTTEQNQLKAFWVELVTRYKNEPTVAGIDVLNEPTVGKSRNWSTDYFWKYAEGVRDAVIAVNPNILVFIEAGPDAQFWRTLGKNVVYEVHDYDPLALSHGAKDWVSIQCRTGARYPGTMQNWEGKNVYYDKNAFAGKGAPEANLRQLYSVDWAQQNNVPLYIGEWGSQSACPGWDQFIADKASLYNEWGLHWSYYSWRANSGNFDIFAARGALTVQNQTAYDKLKEALGGASLPEGTPATSTPIPAATIAPARTATPTRTPTRTNTPIPRTPLPTITLTPSPRATATCAADQVQVKIEIEGRRLILCAWVQ